MLSTMSFSKCHTLIHETDIGEVPYSCTNTHFLLIVSSQITGPSPNTPNKFQTTPTSTPLPRPTPLSPFALPAPPPSQDGKPLYVSGSQAERQARQGRMSSPLRRGTHESWWTREMDFFNAVARVDLLNLRIDFVDSY